MVELLNHLVRHHHGDLIGGGHENVIPGRTGLELCEHGLVGVERIDYHAAVVLCFELGYDPCIDIVAPRIDVKFLLGRAAARQDTEGERTARQDFDCIH